MRNSMVGLLIVAMGVMGCGDRQRGTANGTGGATAAAVAESAGAIAASSSSAAPSAVSDGDRVAVLKAASLVADARGMVENECGEKVTPQLLPVTLGSAGSAVLLVMTGGPNSATCYGDGPGLTLMKGDGAAWRQIYASRGGMMAVMQETKNGAPMLVHGGPGFSHPAFEWNGREYVSAKRDVADQKLAEATILP